MELNFNVDLFEWTAWKKGHFHELFLEQLKAVAEPSEEARETIELSDSFESLGPFFVELTRKIAKKLYRHTPEDRLEYLVGYKSEIARNQIIINEIWLSPLERAMILWFVARDIFSYYVDDIGDNEKRSAIFSVYTRGLLIYREILALCAQGFADGALARWRTLHEVSVVLNFLIKNELEISRRFLASEKVRTLRIQKSVYERQKISPKTLRDFSDHFHQEMDKLKIEFGESITRDWGWAYPNKVGSYNFKNIENDSSYTSVRPWVRASSALVHASHLWPDQLLGTPHWDNSGPIVGSSPYGIEVPLREAAKSISLMAIDMKPVGDFKADDIILINLIDIYSQKLFSEIKKSMIKSNIYTNQIKSIIEAESDDS